MEVRLVVLNGKHAGQKISIRGPKFLIGRAEDCQLRPRSDLISHHHCAILVREKGAVIEDLGSTHGTLVNGQRVEGQRELKSGDKLRVGPLEFEVALEISLKGPKKPKVRSVQEAAARTVEAATSEEELDVTSWLTGEQSESTEAKTGSPGKWSGEDSGSDSASEAGADEPTKEEDEGEKEKKKTKFPPGVWEKSKKKPKAPSSREAAEEALKNFFKRY